MYLNVPYLFKYCIFACMPGKNQVKHLSVYWACVYILKQQKNKDIFSYLVKQVISTDLTELLHGSNMKKKKMPYSAIHLPYFLP